MGGIGSSRWADHPKRKTVEECRFIRIGRGGEVWAKFPPGAWSLAPHPSGLSWAFLLQGGRDGALTTQTLTMDLWQPRFGGVAAWWVCPRCSRHCNSLYAPPRQTEFACRSCWGLAYRSSQEAHYYDRGALGQVFAPGAAACGYPLSDVKHVLNGEWRKVRCWASEAVGLWRPAG